MYNYLISSMCTITRIFACFSFRDFRHNFWDHLTHTVRIVRYYNATPKLSRRLWKLEMERFKLNMFTTWQESYLVVVQWTSNAYLWCHMNVVGGFAVTCIYAFHVPLFVTVVTFRIGIVIVEVICLCRLPLYKVEHHPTVELWIDRFERTKGELIIMKTDEFRNRSINQIASVWMFKA